LSVLQQESTATNISHIMFFDEIYNKYYHELRRFGSQLNLSVEKCEDFINKRMDDQLINRFLRQLDDEDPEVRINAINKLGETGDELCLKELRGRLKNISSEHQALIIAVGKLKKSLGLK